MSFFATTENVFNQDLFGIEGNHELMIKNPVSGIFVLILV